MPVDSDGASWEFLGSGGDEVGLNEVAANEIGGGARVDHDGGEGCDLLAS